MIKTLYTSFDKAQIPALPRVFFEGKIVVIDQLEECDKAVDMLMQESILGFDTETRPSFKKGVVHHVALLQVSTETTCFLFRLNKIGMPVSLLRLLEDTGITKIALSWHDDLHNLMLRKQFKPGDFIELQNVAPLLGINDKSLQKLYANLFRQRISKADRLSNWENIELTHRQQVYAATDAWACIMLYKEIMKLKENGNFSLVDTRREAELSPVTMEQQHNHTINDEESIS